MVRWRQTLRSSSYHNVLHNMYRTYSWYARLFFLLLVWYESVIHFLRWNAYDLHTCNAKLYAWIKFCYTSWSLFCFGTKFQGDLAIKYSHIYFSQTEMNRSFSKRRVQGRGGGITQWTLYDYGHKIIRWYRSRLIRLKHLFSTSWEEYTRVHVNPNDVL